MQPRKGELTLLIVDVLKAETPKLQRDVMAGGFRKGIHHLYYVAKHGKFYVTGPQTVLRKTLPATSQVDFLLQVLFKLCVRCIQLIVLVNPS